MMTSTACSVALIHSWFCQVNFHYLASSVDMGKIFHLTGCSVVCEFHGIRISGSAPGGGGHSNQDGLGRPPRSLRHLFLPRITRATVAGFDKIVRAYKSVTRKRPYKRHPTGLLNSAPSFSFFFLRLLRRARFRSRRRNLAWTRSAVMGKEKTVALERVKKATVKAKGKRTSRGGSWSRSGLPPGWI